MKASEYQVRLCEIIAFDTGIDLGAPLLMEMRHLPTLRTNMLQMSKARGARGGSLRVPPTWTQDGVFKLIVVSDSVTMINTVSVQHRFTLVTLPVPLDRRLTDRASKEIILGEELHSVSNFSEQSASIASGGTTETLSIASLGVFVKAAECDGGKSGFPGLGKKFAADAEAESLMQKPVSTQLFRRPPPSAVVVSSEDVP